MSYEEVFENYSDEKLVESYVRMVLHPGVAGNFVLAVSTCKNEVEKRNLMKECKKRINENTSGTDAE